MGTLSRHILPLALAATAATNSGCVESFGHYEPALVSPPDVTEYSRDIASVEVPLDADCILATPIGIRSVPGGVNVDVVFAGRRVGDALGVGRMEDGSPFSPFWISIGDEPGKAAVAGLPSRVVDSAWLDLSPGACIDEVHGADIMQTVGVPGDPHRVVVTLPVCPDHSYRPGDTCFVAVLLHKGDEPSVLLTKWNHGSFRYECSSVRALVVR